ncbi:MAG TPA: methyltransferase [Blastocatellia bacterium]|jgi:SAM-dependent methyltransferase|nr:methyltransferase [Blastocatellia bacterium]
MTASSGLNASPPGEQFPLRLGSAEDFARVESLLKSSEFNEAAVCGLLRISEMADLSAIKPQEVDLTAASETLALLIRIFLFTEAVGREEVEALIDPATLESFLALDVLRVGEFNIADGDNSEAYYSSVFLYPVVGLLIASDRNNNPDGSHFAPPPDIVFPAINGGTLLFLKLIPKSPARSILDIGSGSGVAALMLSACAQHVVASDVTSRAAHFASFNRLLNRRDNVEVASGDLYSAVEGQTFDRIVAHPPYVPSLSQTTIFRDGGETGEALVKRIIEGLPEYLRPGGTYYSLCLGLDTKEARFEERVRDWLGESHDEFDVLFVFADERSPEQFVQDWAKWTNSIASSDLARWDDIFTRVGARSLVYGAVVVHRHGATLDANSKDADSNRQTPAVTARRRLGAETRGTHIEWALRWHRARARADSPQKIAYSRPRLSPRLQVRTTHVVKDGALVPSNFVFETEVPFPIATRLDPWIVPVIAEFNGSYTPAHLYESASSNSLLPEALTRADFIDLVALLVERGYLDVDESIFLD